MNNFKQILNNIDVFPLLYKISQYPELWNIDDSWTKYKPDTTAIYETDNIVLRFNKSSQPGLNDWDKEAFNILYEAQKIIFDVMRVIPGEHLGKVIITKLRPGEVIKEHIDHWPVPGLPYFQRYQIPLQCAPGVIFKVENEELYMKPVSAYWFDNQKMHSVTNNSNEDRISMLTDIRPWKLPESNKTY